MIEVLRTVRVEDGDAFAELRPGAADGLDLALSIEFDAAGDRPAGADACALAPRRVPRELARARTFTLAHEIDGLRAAGLARAAAWTTRWWWTARRC